MFVPVGFSCSGQHVELCSGTLLLISELVATINPEKDDFFLYTRTTLTGVKM